MGAMRSLLISERTSATRESWIRDGGFAHVLVASGIHLLVIEQMLESVCLRIGKIFRLNALVCVYLVRILKWSAYLAFWALSGFRAGLLRALLIQGFRDVLRSTGRVRSSAVLLAWSCALDCLLAVLFSIGNATTMDEFGAGRLHYALSIYGGYFGYGFAKKRGWNGLRAHAMLAIFSWLPVACLDLVSEGKISFLTPVFSLFTLPLLSSVVLPVAFFYLAIGWGEETLKWVSVFWNRILNWGVEFSFTHGFYRELRREQIPLALVSGVVLMICFIWIRSIRAENQRRRRPPSTTNTSPVIHEASSLRKKRIAAATSWGSPTRPIGKAEPRRA